MLRNLGINYTTYVGTTKESIVLYFSWQSMSDGSVINIRNQSSKVLGSQVTISGKKVSTMTISSMQKKKGRIPLNTSAIFSPPVMIISFHTNRLVADNWKRIHGRPM